MSAASTSELRVGEWLLAHKLFETISTTMQPNIISYNSHLECQSLGEDNKNIDADTHHNSCPCFRNICRSIPVVLFGIFLTRRRRSSNGFGSEPRPRYDQPILFLVPGHGISERGRRSVHGKSGRVACVFIMISSRICLASCELCPTEGLKSWPTELFSRCNNDRPRFAGPHQFSKFTWKKAWWPRWFWKAGESTQWTRKHSKSGWSARNGEVEASRLSCDCLVGGDSYHLLLCCQRSFQVQVYHHGWRYGWPFSGPKGWCQSLGPQSRCWASWLGSLVAVACGPNKASSSGSTLLADQLARRTVCSMGRAPMEALFLAFGDTIFAIPCPGPFWKALASFEPHLLLGLSGGVLVPWSCGGCLWLHCHRNIRF